MSDYMISVCSTADMNQEAMDKYGLKYAMFTYIIDNVNYKDDLYQTISAKDFYQKIVDGATPTTSQVSAAEYMDLWEPALSAGKDVLHLCLSSGISGSYNSAVIAVDMAKAKYPDRKVYAIDSLNASSGFGLIAVMARQNQDKGMSIDENAKWVEENKTRIQTWFFVSDLTCLIRGGRVSKVAGAFGKMLNICPYMYVAKDGTLQLETKLRGRKNCIKAMLETMKDKAENGADYDKKVFITNSQCLEDSKAVAELLESNFPKMDGKVEHYDIGAVIGSHTGPGTVALSFFGEKRQK